ncbi:hypothetical protein ACXYN8_06640 [Altererythrobacter sp. CAU 1778]
MSRLTTLLACAALGSLAACSAAEDDKDNDTELETATTDGEAAALAQAIEAGDFADLQLGARVEGPQGAEVTSAMSNAEGNFADITSFVACPAGMDPCDPANAPEGTVFTYVHTVYPGEDNDPGTGVGSGNSSSDIERAAGFRMTQAAHGFTGAAGYSKGEVVAATGATGQVVVTCNDGKLQWTVDSGDGGDQWENREPITFWWQSTLPPAGPAKAYAIDANYTEASGDGPYPAAREGAVNACDAQAKRPA